MSQEILKRSGDKTHLTTGSLIINAALCPVGVHGVFRPGEWRPICVKQYGMSNSAEGQLLLLLLLFHRKQLINSGGGIKQLNLVNCHDNGQLARMIDVQVSDYSRDSYHTPLHGVAGSEIVLSDCIERNSRKAFD